MGDHVKKAKALAKAAKAGDNDQAIESLNEAVLELVKALEK